MVPLLVPFSKMFTPGKPDPSSAPVTLPETVLLCDHAMVDTNTSKTVKYLLNR
jgi:hypothetical protein